MEYRVTCQKLTLSNGGILALILRLEKGMKLALRVIFVSFQVSPLYDMLAKISFVATVALSI